MERRMNNAALTIEADGHTQPAESHQAAIGWAVLHLPTQEAYRRSTGEDISPALDRYRTWVEENLIGRPGTVGSEANA